MSAAAPLAAREDTPPRFVDATYLVAAFERLRAGASVIYATGPRDLAALPGVRGNATWLLVRRMVSEGRATLAFGRDPREPGRFAYRIYNSGLVAAADVRAVLAVSGTSPLADAQFAESPLGQVYSLLCRCAKNGRACPSNEKIAEALCLDRDNDGQPELTGRRARSLFAQLVSEGLIAVIEPNRFGTRVIEICASGARTAAAEGSKRNG